MRLLFGRAVIFAGAAALIFFCSCERHHPDELRMEDRTVVEPTDHGKAAHEKKHHDPIGQSHGSPGPTPAEFFPSATPH